MLAYHSDSNKKSAILKQLKAHAKADEIIKGRFWEYGKGCAVGCTIHSSEHLQYESRFGIPQMLARLEDCIFEGLPNGHAKKWPIEFMSAITPGADLSRVGWKFLHWILTDKKVNPGISHPLVRDAVKRCANIMADLSEGKAANISAAENAASAASAAAAASAAWSTENAAWSAAWSARSMENAASAASAARSAAWSAWSTAYAAWSKENAACSAAWSARSAASAASAAWSTENAASAASAAASAAAAKDKAYIQMSKKLISLLRATKPCATTTVLKIDKKVVREYDPPR
jgi:hypothetical protein